MGAARDARGVPPARCARAASAVNVPSWRGKRFLESRRSGSGLRPAEEMDDHKTYYDPRDLWPLLVRAGFRPHDIRCFTHKFGLNTFAVVPDTTEGERT